MADLAQERAQLDAEWEKLRIAKEEFKKELEANEEKLPEQKLFVGNLDENTTEEEVRALFEAHGSVKEVYMLKDKEGKSKRSSFVKMYTKSSAERAIEEISGKIQDKEQEKMIVVRFAANKAVSAFMPPQAFAGHQAHQQASYGAMGAMHGAPAQNYAPAPGFAFAAQPAAYGGYAPEQGYAAGGGYSARGSMSGMGGGAAGGAGGGGPGRGPPGSNLYINNVAQTASEDEVRAMFSDFGHVLSVKLFALQGYGFVSFDNAQSASNAIHALNGLAIGNGQKRLEVSLKKDKMTPRFSPY